MIHYNFQKFLQVESGKVCPADVPKDKGLRTVCAYDNYDRFIDTGGPKLTMNDTVGILIQDIEEPVQLESSGWYNFYVARLYILYMFISSFQLPYFTYRNG